MAMLHWLPRNTQSAAQNVRHTRMLFLVLLVIFGKLNSKLALDCLMVVLLYQERTLMQGLMQI